MAYLNNKILPQACKIKLAILRIVYLTIFLVLPAPRLIYRNKDLLCNTNCLFLHLSSCKWKSNAYKAEKKKTNQKTYPWKDVIFQEITFKLMFFTRKAGGRTWQIVLSLKYSVFSKPKYFVKLHHF